MNRRWAFVLAVAASAGLFAVRIHDIQNHFWLFEDQTRDWALALQAPWQLPLVGSPTHVHGYTLGPAFYWILWTIHATLGKIFGDFPHIGGIGQALYATLADLWLAYAVAKRTRSIWTAAIAWVLWVSPAFDLSLAALVWNPTMGETMAKAACAMMLLRLPDRSWRWLAVTAAVTWMSVHVYTGCIYVAVTILGLLVVEPIVRGGALSLRRALKPVLVCAAVIAALQLPYVIHQFQTRFSEPAMSVVTGGVADVASGKAAAEWRKSVDGFVNSMASFEWPNATTTAATTVLVLSALLFSIRRRRDPAFVVLIIAPQLLAIVGYALFLGALDSYYYLSLTPLVVVMVIDAASMPARLPGRHIVSAAMLAGAVSVVPARFAQARTMFQLPEYRAIAQGSRALLRLNRPLHAIELTFEVPPGVDSEYVYKAIGGVLARDAEWDAAINADGSVRYSRVPR
jgi:hypothetical protein